MREVSEIQKCPKCGDEARVPDNCETEHVYYVECPNCGCRGPWSKRRQTAINIWNTLGRSPTNTWGEQ